mgnify:FL=1
MASTLKSFTVAFRISVLLTYFDILSLSMDSSHLSAFITFQRIHLIEKKVKSVLYMRKPFLRQIFLCLENLRVTLGTWHISAICNKWEKTIVYNYVVLNRCYHYSGFNKDHHYTGCYRKDLPKVFSNIFAILHRLVNKF